MYIGSAIFLIAVGAILRWAVSWEVSGFNIQLAGLIVFLVGILGLVITLVLWYTRRNSRDTRIVRGTRTDDGSPPQEFRPDDSGPRP
jgi:fluoride ion exporter CrcB/FEX